ncbi:MAG: hypothetical protein Kow00117_11150 [Phototrophicales bacterium]
MKQWIDPPQVTVPNDLLALVEGNALLAETLVRRGITDVPSARAFLDPDQYMPSSPYDLPDMTRAVTRVQQAIQANETICVWGDFDVDGQTSTSLLVSGLRTLGATVVYYIPHRERENHGVHLGKLNEFIDSGIQLLITCDTGITAHKAVDYANSRGVDVVITDHHQLPEALPSAYAVVNPQRLPADHPMHTLAGVGAAYKLMEALYHDAELDPDPLLDLVAMGLIADVVPLKGEARYLVQRGLAVLNRTERLGLKLLQERIGVTTIDEEVVAFQIAPRMNAVGRLDDANVVVEFLTTDDEVVAEALVNRLEGLNEQRKLLTEQVLQGAIQQIADNPQLLDAAVLVLAHERWHGGIIGIVANKLVEQYNRPVVLLRTGVDGLARGSARSVPGVNITQAIQSAAGILHSYGGHTMAAGLSLPTERIPDLRRALSKAVYEMREVVPETLTIDAYIPLSQANLALYETIRQLAPFGAGNPPLTLATCKVNVKTHKTIGQSNKHVRLTVEDEAGTLADLLWWHADPETLPPGRLDIAYSVGINEWQGERTAQLILVDFRPVDEAPQQYAHRTTVEIVDHRNLDLGTQMAELILLDNVLVWNEGDPIPGVNSLRRRDLHPAEALAIWTAPPDQQTLHQALNQVNPARIILFGVDPKCDSVQIFLKRFAGAIKHVLNAKGGCVQWDELAGVMAHRKETVQAGLDWMLARGHINIMDDNGERVCLAAGENISPGGATSTAKLASLLQETKAYRAYFRRADASVLLAPQR